MLRPSPTRFEFGPFELDLARRTLSRAGARVPLNSRAFDTLVALTQQPGEILDKDYLLKAVWADAIVEEKNLTVQIAALRKALGDDLQVPEFIATVPGRGYQFTAPVRPVWEDDGAPVTEQPVAIEVEVEAAGGANKSRRILVAVAAIAIVGIAAVWSSGAFPRSTGAAGDVRSIAILPVRSLVPNEQDGYLEIGLADALITRLSRLGAVTVRPTSAVRQYTASDQDARAAGTQLQVDAVVDAHLQREGDRVRLTARLIRVRDGAPLWADTFDEPISNLFALEDALSSRLVQALSLTLTGEARARLSAPSSRNPAAYQAYLKGRYFWGKWTRDGLDTAIGHFTDALNADPAFALAHAGLADAYELQGYLRFVRPAQAFSRARETVARALELDDTLMDAHLVKAKILFFFDWDFAGAGREIQRALAIDTASAEAHGFNGAYLMALGDFGGAHSERLRALALDPLSPLNTNAVGWTFFYQRRYDDAIAWHRKALELDRGFVTAQNSIAQAHFLAGRTSAAVDAQLAVRALGGVSADEIARVRQVFDAGGIRAYWQDELRRASGSTRGAPVDAFRLARIHYELGDLDQAMLWLERSFEERDSLMVFMKVTPMFERLHSDARYRDLLRRIGV